MDLLGLDFGTSTTLVALGRKAGVAVIPIGETERWLPSLVAPGPQNGLLLAEAAIGRPSVLRSIKVAITHRRDSVVLGNREVGVEDAIGQILAQAVMKASIRAERPGLANEATLRMACPAMWDRNQRLRLVAAAGGAGLQVDLQQVIDEPVAAGVAWVSRNWQEREGRPTGKVLVADWGGGTLDVAVLKVTGADPYEIDVLASDSLSLAGDELDDRIAERVLAQLVSLGAPPSLLKDRTDEIRVQAEKLKVRASTVEGEVEVLPPGTLGEWGPVTCDRTELDQVSGPLLHDALVFVDGVLRASHLRDSLHHDPVGLRKLSHESLSAEIDHVLLVGGTTLLPNVRLSFESAFPLSQVCAEPNPQEAVVKGLASDEAYSHLNLQHPSFDFVVEFADGRSQTLYQAFTPLYDKYQVLRGEFLLGHTAVIHPPSGGLSGEAQLRCFTTDRRPVTFEVNHVRRDTLPMKLDEHRSGRFKLYVGGAIMLDDGRDNTMLCVSRWPVTGGVGAPLALTQGSGSSHGWHHGTPGEPG